MEQFVFGLVARIQVEVTDSPRNQSPSSRRTCAEKSQSDDPGCVMPQSPKVTEKKSTTCLICITVSESPSESSGVP